MRHPKNQDEDDLVLVYMRKNNIPMTRENYIDLAFSSHPGEILDLESKLPPQFRRSAAKKRSAKAGSG